MIINDVLVCDKCEYPMGRAPAGTSEKTKALCRNCTAALPGSGMVPVGGKVGLIRQADRRRPADSNRASLKRAHAIYDRWKSKDRHLGEPTGVRLPGLKRPSIPKTLSAAWLDRIVAAKSAYITRAWRNNERWAAAAKTEFIIKLPRRRLCALLLVAFFDVPIAEAAYRLGIREQSLRYNVMMAKQDLVKMLDGAPQKKFYERTNPKKDFHFSTEAYVN